MALCTVADANRNASSCNFGDDLLIQILSRLPQKALIRCKCISKSWHHLISTLIHSQTKPFSGLFFRLIDHRQGNIESVEYFPRGEDDPFITDAYLSFLPCYPYTKILDCRDGFLLCSPSKFGQEPAYYVCNPVTRQWVTLPQPLQPSSRRFDVNLALVFDDQSHVSTSHYKVFCFLTIYDEKPEPELDIDENPEPESDINENPDAKSDSDENPEVELDIDENPVGELDMDENPEAELDIDENPEVESDMDENPEAESDMDENPEGELDMDENLEAESDIDVDFCGEEDDPLPNFYFDVYSSETGRWAGSKAVFKPASFFLSETQPVFLNGALYLIAPPDHVLRFDVKEECCQVMDLPTIFDMPTLVDLKEKCGQEIDIHTILRMALTIPCYCLGVSEGRLNYSFNNRYKMKIWTLNECNNSEWVLKHSIDIDDIEYPEDPFGERDSDSDQDSKIAGQLDVLAFHPNLDAIYLRDQGEIFSYNFHSRTSERVISYHRSVYRDMLFRACPFSESLYSLCDASQRL